MSARAAAPHEASIAVDILVDAFYDDPTWSWAFPDPAVRRTQHRLLWQAFVDGAMRYSTVWLNDNESATAVWVPPGGTEMTPEQETELLASLEAVPGTDVALVLETMSAFEAAHPHHEPHHILSLLGTASAHRGNGYGLRLLAETLVAIDAADEAAYLEASNPANIALYERYGFERFGAFAMPANGPVVTTMWRRRRSEVR